MRASYTPAYYDGMRAEARSSAAAVLPLVLEIARPRSIVDIGCGTGAWLAEALRLGVESVLGVDGGYVLPEKLEIGEDRFVAADLEQPLRLERRFDLAIALEVAEHLRPEFATQFVQSLVDAAPVVLFSAAIPMQGGELHVNEQWPNYWAELFARHHYVTLDPIRRLIWSDERVAVFYRQNILLFAHEDRVRADPRLQEQFERTSPEQLRLVHPDVYMGSVAAQLSGRNLVEELLRRIGHRLRRRWNGR